MSQIKAGERVKIVDRDMTLADTKSGLYYDYFRNLTGKVQYIYDDKTVCVNIELDSLPEDIRTRHLEVQESTTKRWLESISQEQRDKLSEANKRLTLAYNVLVSESDLEPSSKSKATSKKKSAASSPPKTKAEAAPERKTAEEIEKAEEEHLNSIFKTRNIEQK